jgi:hypothetical protein
MAGLSSGITAATGFGKITAPTPCQTQVFGWIQGSSATCLMGRL